MSEHTPTPTPQPTIAQLQEQIADLKHLISTLTPQTKPTFPSLSSKTLKVATPDPFDGTPSKADAFISQLILYFHGKRNEIQDDHDKIILALSYMKGGTAGPWAKRKVKQYAGEEEITQDWDEFYQEFQQTFGDPDPASTARHKMEHLKQGSHTADEYVASFRELQEDTGYNDAALVEMFERGLNSALVDKIYALPQMPSTLSDWTLWATKLDRQWRQREVKKKSFGNSSFSKQATSPPKPSKPFTPTPTPFTRPPPTVKESEPVPMEVDSGWKTVKPIICWKCRKPGHVASKCRSTIDINSMDFDSLKAYMKQELQKEQEPEKADFQGSPW